MNMQTTGSNRRRYLHAPRVQDGPDKNHTHLADLYYQEIEAHNHTKKQLQQARASAVAWELTCDLLRTQLENQARQQRVTKPG